MQLKKFYFFHTQVRNIDTVLDATTMSLYSFSIIQFYRFDNEFKVKVEAPVKKTKRLAYCQAQVPIPVPPRPNPNPKVVPNHKVQLGLGLTLKSHGPQPITFKSGSR